jgi:RNA 2',3'-cyclic 3'-phosphodiesterase
MRLFAAIVPPRAVLEEVLEVVQGVQGVRPGQAQETRRGLRARFGGRGPTTEQVEKVEKDELTIADLAQMYVPLTGFGNVTFGDSVQLSKALRNEAQTWERPTVQLAGGTALEFRGDESVWAKITGDLDALGTIGRGVPQVVQRLGFFVDRRQFRPWISVGTITESTTAPFLQSVVDALEAFQGQTWTIESISLMKRLPEEGPHAFEEMEEMPLAHG